MSYTKKNGFSKYNNKICDNQMTFDECELAILRHAIDENETVKKQETIDSEEVRKMFNILERFIVKKKLVIYGGLALNRLMPKHDRFYNEDVDMPDYDVYSENALDDAKALADIYHKSGYSEVETKSGMHYGTFKVFVNFIGIADITLMPVNILNKLRKEAVNIGGIRCAPPNFLRMSMYLEMSRPQGDLTRWEKIYKRLTLLNKHYPLKTPFDCDKLDFQRKVETESIREKSENLYYLVRDSFIDQGVVFFGGYASLLYSRYMPERQQLVVQHIPDFDVLALDPELCASVIEDMLEENGYKTVKLIRHEAIGEMVPEHIQINVGNDTVAIIYKPIACHSYNVIQIDGRNVNVATIDTMLNFYLAFLYADQPYYGIDRVLCLSHFLFEVQENNRLLQKGLLRRFHMLCYGKQPQLEDLRAEKANKFRELSGKRNSREYEMWFLRYNPATKKQRQQRINSITPVDGSKSATKTKKKANNRTRKNRGVIEPKFAF